MNCSIWLHRFAHINFLADKRGIWCLLALSHSFSLSLSSKCNRISILAHAVGWVSDVSWIREPTLCHSTQRRIHRQNTKLCISMVWKGTTVFDVLTTHLSSNWNAWQESSRSTPAVAQGCYSASLKLWTLIGSHSAFNDPTLRGPGLSTVTWNAAAHSKPPSSQRRDSLGSGISKGSAWCWSRGTRVIVCPMARGKSSDFYQISKKGVPRRLP